MPKQVTCITKREHYNPHERIVAIGGTTNGLRWSRPEDSAIRDIETGAESYFTSVNGKSVWVVVATHTGRKYLKTEPDAFPANNLLNLNDCPR